MCIISFPATLQHPSPQVFELRQREQGERRLNCKGEHYMEMIWENITKEKCWSGYIYLTYNSDLDSS